MTRTCTKCKTPRAIGQFVKDRTRPDGLYSICKPCRKDYHLRNRDYIVAKQRRYNSTHIAEIKESHKRYALKRFFYIRANNLSTKVLGESASYVELAHLWKQQRGRCAVTDRRLNRQNSHLDHIVSIVKGGKSTIENLRWVHRDVNYAKRDLSEAEFLSLCREVVALNQRKEGY